MLHDEVSDVDDIEEAKYAHVNDINNQDKVPLSPMVTDMIKRKTKKKWILNKKMIIWYMKMKTLLMK